MQVNTYKLDIRPRFKPKTLIPAKLTMAVLSSKQVLKDNNTTDPSSITSLTLTHKALSDVKFLVSIKKKVSIFVLFHIAFSRFHLYVQVSCLSEFENLQKLDLGFNNLTSLEVKKLLKILPLFWVVQCLVWI